MTPCAPASWRASSRRLPTTDERAQEARAALEAFEAEVNRLIAHPDRKASLRRLADAYAQAEAQRGEMAVLDDIERWCEQDENPDDEDDLGMLIGKLRACVKAGGFQGGE